MKYLVAVVLFYCFQNSSKAQFLNAGLLKSYSPEIVSRVYEISLMSLCSDQTSFKIADFLKMKDSILVSEVVNKVNPKLVEQKIDSLEFELEKIFSEPERKRYLYIKNKRYIQAESAVIAKYLKEKYKSETDFESVIKKLYTSRCQHILDEKVYLYGESTELSSESIKYYTGFDSILNAYLVFAEGESFLRDKLAELEKLKPIEKSVKSEIRKNYQTLCLKFGNSYQENFTTALKYVLKDKIFHTQLFQDSLFRIAEDRAKERLREYGYIYNLSESNQRAIAPLVKERERKLVELESSALFTRKRDSIEFEVKNIYRIKINAVLIKAGYTQLDNSKIVDALKYKDQLKITAAQTDSLINAYQQIETSKFYYKVSTKGVEKDVDFLTTFYLQLFLTQGQYDSLLMIVVQPKSMELAKSDWSELKKRGIVNEIDSIKEFRSIFAYHISRSLIWEKYYSNKTLYNKLTKELQKSRPQLLTKLYELYRKENESDFE